MTRYCSKKCNSRHYKSLERDNKFKVHNAIQIINTSSSATHVNTTGQEYYEVSEAACILKVSRRTLYRLIALKKLKKKKVMSRTVILKEDIKIFFAAQ
ncbi:MAG TPA: helix-turn-helix domain-containing protein [Ohtaekwangia sp.]